MYPSLLLPDELTFGQLESFEQLGENEGHGGQMLQELGFLFLVQLNLTISCKVTQRKPMLLLSVSSNLKYTVLNEKLPSSELTQN